MHLVDLSQPIANGTAAYPGLPQPEIAAHLSRDDSSVHYGGLATFQIDRINMVGNTGTYIDAPFHRFSDGDDLAGLALDRVANIPGIVVSVPHDIRAITAAHVPAQLPRYGCVLFHTGWDRLWNTGEYVRSAPFVTREAALVLAKAEVALVGIDSANIDDIADGARPTHTILLERGVTIVEHLRNVGALQGKTFRFFAVPPRVREMGSFPVRAFAIVV